MYCTIIKCIVTFLLQLSDAIERGKKYHDKGNGSRNSTPTNFTHETDYEMVHVTVTESDA